jgi:hypothetical protein
MEPGKYADVGRPALTNRRNNRAQMPEPEKICEAQAASLNHMQASRRQGAIVNLLSVMRQRNDCRLTRVVLQLTSPRFPSVRSPDRPLDASRCPTRSRPPAEQIRYSRRLTQSRGLTESASPMLPPLHPTAPSARRVDLALRRRRPSLPR